MAIKEEKEEAAAEKKKKKKNNERDKVSITKSGVGIRHSQHKSKHIHNSKATAIFINIVVINKLCYYIKTSWLEERVLFFSPSHSLSLSFLLFSSCSLHSNLM